jgi:hypothetical protein
MELCLSRIAMKRKVDHFVGAAFIIAPEGEKVRNFQKY